MDREIATDVKRWRRIRRGTLGVALLAAGSGIFVFLPSWLRPSLPRARILTARVERGTVETTIEASGTVIPAEERVVSSPIDTRIVRILKRPGDAVRRGEALLELDTEATKLDLDRIEDRLAQKRNEQTQVRLALERSLDDLDGEIQKAGLEEELRKARHERNLRMNADGLISEEALRESEVEARKAGIDLSRLNASVASARRATDSQLEGLRLDLAVLEKEADEARHRLELATARADRDGVLTSVASEEGASVRRGDVLARIARLDAFRVEATVSDVHAPRLSAGLPVRVLVGGDALEGTVATVYPRIENGVVRFGVELRDVSSSGLRQNLRVDVLVVTGSRENTLRLRRGPYAQAAGATQQVFVIDGDRALRRTLSLGLAGRDFLEVRSGLAEGDEVIVSDMTDYLHLSELKLR